MKNKIQQFAKGDFKIERPDIVFSETHILITVGEGEQYEGSFVIKNQKDGDIRGLVYPSSFRVQIASQGFEGNPVKVKFIYDSTGLLPGHIENGKLTIVCNGGEYELAFTAIIEKPFIMTTYGKVQSIADFKKLAVQDFAEAKQLFKKRQFYDVLKYEDVRVKNLYENMRTWSLDEQALEEFLVGIKQKEKIFLTLSDEKKELEHVLEDTQDYIDIVKNTWGYVLIHISALGDFIGILRNEITTEDFMGNEYRLEYVIQKQKLHAGRNVGKICIATPYETLEVEIEVYQQSEKNDSFGLIGMIAGQSLKEYLSCISGRLDVNEWVERAIGAVKQMRDLEPENEHYLLLQAHIYLRGRRLEEAKWVLDHFNYSRFTSGRKPEINAYYLFLTALLRKDTTYTTKVLEEINRLYMKHPYSWPLLCMMINLDMKYRDYRDRLRVLERQFFNGANQVLLYAEAYICLQEKVLLLRKLESFELQILNFATKYKIITRELALHAADLISQQKAYNKKMCLILKRAYQLYEEPRILNAICMQLIKGNRIGAEYVQWYEKAIAVDLKIAQLYEYYMMSVNEERVNHAFPKIVYLYFMHGITLDDKKTALLYANILTYESEESEIYHYYRNQIKQFAWEQLEKRHINASLRILYNRFLKEEEMTPDALEAAYDICHAYQVKPTNPDMKYVLVIEKDGTIRQRVACKESGAKIYLYSKDARIVWEGKDGLHYTDSVPYESKRLFYELHFLEMCKNRITERSHFEREDSRLPVTFENLKKCGLQMFDEQEVFLLCSRHIREAGYEEDDFLTYLGFELLKKGQYDKALLTYLARFYCGATCDMKFVWRKAKEYGVSTGELAERIITQMLFSEVIFQEEEIFIDYYESKPYFRLKQSYLAYISRLYVLKNREIDGRIFALILQEYMQKESLPEICKIAVLKYYADKTYDSQTEEILKQFFRELCSKHMIFAFYLSYPKSWLKEVQLYDKVIVQYEAEGDGSVKIVYRIVEDNAEEVNEQTESLNPVYETIYIKEFVLFRGEKLQYHFEENDGNEQVVSETFVLESRCEQCAEGRFGRLNTMLQMSDEQQKQAMIMYMQEEEIAKEFFRIY